MNICKIFIDRPVATTMIISALLIFGLFAYPYLPVSELPNVDFPTIQVSASLPGADPETMAVSVATPIEKELSTIAGIDSMSSISSAGNTNITLQFSLDRNIDAAAQDVQSALLQVAPQLPNQMTTPPSIRKVNPADSPILFLALTANNVPMTKVDDYAQNYISPRLSMEEGVSQVSLYGSQQFAVRVQINPNALTNRKLSMDMIASAIQNLNTNQPSGTIYTEGTYRLLKVDGQLMNADQFGNSVVSSNQGAPVRLKDIATVKDSVENDKALTWYNKKPAIVLAIERQPGANTIQITKNILSLLPSLTSGLPGGAKLSVVYNRSDFIEASIKDVQYSLLLAVFLVIAVIFLFLRNFSSTVIAVFSLPISIIATFGFMYLLNYNLDNLSLMGLVLAVGFVIDDAVVVLENIMRYIESGMDRLSASLKGSQEISFTIVAMTLSLVAVFIPIFFMGGIIGRLFHEFAAVVGIAILASGFVALTLIPMLCSRYLREPKETHQYLQGFGRCYDKSKAFYERSLRWTVERVRLILLVSLGILFITGALFYIIPKGFIPSEDAGRIVGSVQAPNGITFGSFLQLQGQAADIILNNPNVEGLISSVGQGAGASQSVNTGRFVIRLKPLGDRKLSADKLIQQLRHQLNSVPGLKIYLTNPPAINIGGKVANNNYQYVLQSTSWDQLKITSSEMKSALLKLPGLQDVDSDLQLNNPELKIHILRDQAAQLGVTPAQIEDALYSAYGSRQVSSIMTSSGDYDVILEIAPEFQKNPHDIDLINIRSVATGQLVPLTSVIQKTETAGALQVNHYGQLPAVTLSFNLAPGYSLGTATDEINTLAEKTLPAGVTGAFAGTAQTFQQSLVTLPILLFFTILVIYMVLAILYEHFSYPLTILTALPFAAFGALLSLLVCNQELDLFSFIGLIMLVGLTKKNGIMMVDFALAAQRKQQLMPKEAIVQACLIRFRPIMMTTLAAIMATLPLALGFGSGGETRRALGIAVVGGLLFSQMITLYVTPAFYLFMSKKA